MNQNIPYPKVATPVPEGFTQVNDQYRLSVFKVFLSMLLFVLGYFLVLFIGGIIVLLSLLFVRYIVMHVINLFVILAGVGILFMAGMIAYFLLKFLFAKSDTDDTNKIEITAVDEPILFQFIQQVCEECKTPMPKKVFLVPDVNASVFYNSSFWSLFLPVKKNLNIGAGLVNSINLSEFKAVLAHEFGHFSQSSTRLGSYVYRINRVIYFTIYENDTFSSTIEKLSGIHSIINFFLRISVEVVRIIVWALTKLYELVNIPYMALSREMEFHADRVAVSVAGSQFVGSSLYRIHIGNNAFIRAMHFAAHSFKKEQKMPRNLYRLMDESNKLFAEINNIPLRKGLPVIEIEQLKGNYAENRIVIADLWASHPEMRDRHAKAIEHYIEGEEIEDSPWVLFKNPEKTQRELSKIQLALIAENAKYEEVEVDNYFAEFDEIRKRSVFRPEYHGYYDNYYYPTFDLNDLQEREDKALGLSFSDVFYPGVDNITVKVDKLKEDLETLDNIIDGRLNIRRFMFDGVVYSAYHSPIVKVDIEKELAEAEKELIVKQELIYLFFYQNLALSAPEKASQYKSLFLFAEQFRTIQIPLANIHNNILELLREVEAGLYDDTIGFTHVFEQMRKYYSEFVAYKENFVLPSIPGVLQSEEVVKDFASKVFAVEVPNPTANGQNAKDFYPFLIAMRDIINNMNELPYYVYHYVIKMQDEWIEHNITT